MSVVLHLDRVSAGYPSRPVLHDLSLRAEAGRLTALLGPSGCGKTTVLKLIAGLLVPETGDIWFGDERMTGVAAEKRGIAMVFQKPLLFPHMSVGDNVAFGLTMRGWPLNGGAPRWTTRCGWCSSKASDDAGQRNCREARSSASRWRGRS